MDKTQLQGIAAHRLAKSQRLICEWATGTGKSGVVMQFLKANPDFDCLIFVPEQNNIENWRAEFKKFGIDDSKVEIACYASIHKYQDTNWYLLVFDEAPHVDTQMRIKSCQSIKASYVLALGAKIDEDERYALKFLYGQFEESKIGFEKAIEMGLLPCPKVYVLHMQIDNQTARNYYKGRPYTDKEYYDVLNRKVENAVTSYDNNHSEFLKRRMLTAGNERKRFLGKIKDDALKKICLNLNKNNLRYLCFCSSIKQANEIGGDNAYTSKTPTSAKLLEKFNNRIINSLFVVGKLIEGQNLNDIQCGVIGQLGGTERITIQSVGRIMRSQNPVIYIPIFDGTKDEGFLYTLTSNIPDKYIQHFKF